MQTESSSQLLQWKGRADPAAPILIIGAGRSGSTLLGRMLDCHPEICFRGETGFLVTKLWNQLWKDRFWLNWQRFVDTQPGSSRDPKPVDDQHTTAQRFRIAGLIAQMTAALLDIEPAASAWGFKEIWNGSGSHHHPWEPYDEIFPRAKWVHLMRHPLAFAGSCAAWNRDELTPEYLQDRLSDWLAITRHSRSRQATERFIEIRYEDLINHPRELLEPILTMAEVQWSDQCLAALQSKVLNSKRDLQREQTLLSRTQPSDDLLQVAAELGYDLSSSQAHR